MMMCQENDSQFHKIISGNTCTQHKQMPNKKLFISSLKWHSGKDIVRRLLPVSNTSEWFIRGFTSKHILEEFIQKMHDLLLWECIHSIQIPVTFKHHSAFHAMLRKEPANTRNIMCGPPVHMYEGCMTNSWTFVATLFSYWLLWNFQTNILNMC